MDAKSIFHIEELFRRHATVRLGVNRSQKIASEH